jgi:hypothetical protein
MNFTRREALQALVMAPVVGVVRTAWGRVPAGAEGAALDAAAPSDAPFADVRPGAKVGQCVVVRIGSVQHGVVPIVLRASDGGTFRVDILRHDDATPGIARAGSLALYLANGGSGGKQTDEEHGLAVMALARLLAAREASGKPVPRLLTLRERSPLLAGDVAPG